MRFDFEIDESLKRERNEKIEKLYTDPLVQQFLKKNDLNHDFFDKHFSYFQDWVENVKKMFWLSGNRILCSNYSWKDQDYLFR